MRHLRLDFGYTLLAALSDNLRLSDNI